MTRVLLVDPSARGGIATYTARLVEALVAAGDPPALLASRGLAVQPGGDAVPVRRALPDHAWGRGSGGPAAFYARRAREAAVALSALARAVRAERPDVVHLQFGLFATLDARTVAALRRRAVVVWTAHDVVPFEGGEQRDLPALRACDAVVVHSDPARALLEAQGVAATVVRHVPAAVPAGAGRDVARAALRRALDLPVEGRLVAALGFVRPYKGYDLLAEVWEALGPAAPLLLVVGEAWSGEDEAVLDRLERTGRAVVRRGYATDAALAQAARAADAVLLPHARASDSGLLHLAVGVGTPVLASDVPQLRASVEGTGAGAVLPRDREAWAAAVTGLLPPAPPASPALADTGRQHLAVYRSAVDRRP